MIVNSSYEVDTHEQKAGGRYVTERHFDEQGAEVACSTYGPVSDEFDSEARMLETAAQLNAQMEREADEGPVSG